MSTDKEVQIVQDPAPPAPETHTNEHPPAPGDSPTISGQTPPFSEQTVQGGPPQYGQQGPPKAVIAAGPAGGVYPAGVMTIPQNLSGWAQNEAVSLAQNFVGQMLQPEQLAMLENALTTVAMAAVIILGNSNAVQVDTAKKQRALALSALDDLKACGFANAADAARKSVAKLMTDGADFALSAATKFI